MRKYGGLTMDCSWYNIGDIDKGGRPRIAPATPEELWERFVAYIQWCIEHPAPSRKQGEWMPRPLTWRGFMAFLGLGYKPDQYKDYYGKKEGFSGVITRIDNVIESNQLDGALVGTFDSNLVARLNGYTEKTETKHHGNLTIKHERTGFSPASSEAEIRKREGIDGTI